MHKCLCGYIFIVLHLCVSVMRVCLHVCECDVCACECGGQKLTLGAFLDHSVLYWFRKDFLLNSEFSNVG